MKIVRIFTVLLWLTTLPGVSFAFDYNMFMGGYSLSILDQELMAKAKPDECYQEIGIVAPMATDGTCPAGTTPKTNAAYVWGLVQSGYKLWFGTAPNVHCLVIGAYLGMSDSPIESDSYVCEFGDSWVARANPLLPPMIGDWRPPQIYSYDLNSKTKVDRTPPDPRLGLTLGIRSAGATDEVVFLGGPGLPFGINLFAFNARTGAYLGSKNFPVYDNIRKWLEFKGQLYTTVGTGDGGRVLKWIGSLTDLWHFEEVGKLDGGGAELAAYGEHIALTTWPTGELSGLGMAGLFISPPVPAGGLTAAHFDLWKKVWSANDYEPDPVVAATYGGGAVAYFDGWLYWGTMNVPMLSAVAHFSVFGTPEKSTDALNVVLKTHRPITIFRGRNLHTNYPQIQLLYGESKFPVYHPESKTFVDHNTGMWPLYGKAGFGNFFNNYTWTMRVIADQLLVGTMDWSYLLDSMADSLLGGDMLPLFGSITDLSSLKLMGNMNGNGADLWRFPSSREPAVCESFDGVGNHLNYGVRTLLVDKYDKNTGYAGSANPMNLEPKGGWELIRLHKPTKSWLPPWLQW